MAKASLEYTAPLPPKKVVLELSVDEAMVVMCVLGGAYGVAGIHDVWDALNNGLGNVDKTGYTFADGTQLLRSGQVHITPIKE